MSGAVFHQGAAKIAAGQTPSLAEISHAVMNVDVGSCEFGQIARKTEHRGCFGPDLHQADLADAAYRARIVAALDRRDGVGDVGRQAVLFRLPFLLARGRSCLHPARKPPRLAPKREAAFSLRFVLDRISAGGAGLGTGRADRPRRARLGEEYPRIK